MAKGWLRNNLWMGAAIAALAPLVAAGAEERSSAAPSPKAVEAIRLLESRDAYQRQLGFLRLEALREASTVPTIRTYAQNRDPDVRAYSLRALAAIEGSAAIPQLLQALSVDKQPVVRRAALLGLEPLEQNVLNADVLLAFIKALRDPSTEIRMTAVDIVSRIDHPRAREAILMRYKKEHRRDVRRVLELAMKRLRAG